MGQKRKQAKSERVDALQPSLKMEEGDVGQERKEMDSSWGPQRERGSADTFIPVPVKLISLYSLQNCKRINVYCFQAIQFVVICYYKLFVVIW